MTTKEDRFYMRYVPKAYKPYVSFIGAEIDSDKKHEPKSNQRIVVVWTVDGESEMHTYQSAAYMFTLLKDFGSSFDKLEQAISNRG